LLRLVLSEDLAWTTLVLLEHWRVLCRLDLGSSSGLLSGGTSLVLENTLIGNHHHHCTIIREDNATVVVSLLCSTLAIAEVAEPLFLLLVHLHHLHDGILHLNLIPTTEG